MYRVTCHTCGETSRTDALEGAQRAFDEHANEQREVELINLETGADEPIADESADSRPASSTADRDRSVR